eukprot:6239342-Amphidinium_carterae.2
MVSKQRAVLWKSWAASAVDHGARQAHRWTKRVMPQDDFVVDAEPCTESASLHAVETFWNSVWGKLDTKAALACAEPLPPMELRRFKAMHNNIPIPRQQVQMVGILEPGLGCLMHC